MLGVDVDIWQSPIFGAGGGIDYAALGYSLALDFKNQNYWVEGPNLISNGDFAGGTTGWTPGGATLAVVGGKLRVTTTSAFGYVYQSFAVVPGASYRLTYDTASISGPAVIAPKVGFSPFDGSIAATPGTASPVAAGTLDFTAPASPIYVTFQDVNGLVGAQFDIDNISVRAVTAKAANLAALPGYAFTRTGQQGALDSPLKAISYGANLLAALNGEFTNDVAGWGGYGGQTLTWSSGAAVASGATDVAIFRAPGLTVGKTYRLTVKLDAATNSPSLCVGTLAQPFANGSKIAGLGVNTWEFVAADPTHSVGVYGNNTTYTVDYIRLEEISAPVGWWPANVPAINGRGFHSMAGLTNFEEQSQDFASRTPTTMTVAANTTVAPDGTLTADTLTATSAGSAMNATPMTLVVGTVYTTSVFVLDGGTSPFAYLQINVNAGGAGAAFVTFDLAGGIAGTSQTLVAGVTLTAFMYRVTGGWRIGASFTVPAGATSTIAYLGPADTANTRTTTIGRTLIAWQQQTIQGLWNDGGPLIATGATTLAIGASNLALTNPVLSDEDFVFWATAVLPDANNLGNNNFQVFGSMNASHISRNPAGNLVAALGGASIFSASPAPAPGRYAVLGRRRAGKTTLGHKLPNGTVALAAEGALAAFPDFAGTLRAGVFSASSTDGVNAPLEGVFIRRGTFSDPQITQILTDA